MIYKVSVTLLAAGTFVFFLARGFADSPAPDASDASDAKGVHAPFASVKSPPRRRQATGGKSTRAPRQRPVAARGRAGSSAFSTTATESGSQSAAASPLASKAGVAAEAGEASNRSKGGKAPPVRPDADRAETPTSAEARLLDSALDFESREPDFAWYFDSLEELEDWEVPWQSEGLNVVPEWVSKRPGYVRLLVPFTRANQAVQFGVSFQEDTPPDLTGRMVKVRLRLATGGGSGGAQLFSQSSGWVWVAHGWTGLDELSEWTELSLELGPNSGDFDPAAVLRVGVQLHSGSGWGFQNNEVHIDSFVIE